MHNMATNIPTECSICTEEYNEEERCPRILPCFHTLCSSCILDIIRSGDKKCPFCIQDFVRERITDFKININALEMLKYIKDLQSKSSQSRNKTGTSQFGEINDLKREISKLNSKNREACLKAQKKLKAVIDRNNLQKDLCISANTTIQNEIIPKAIIIVSRNNKHVLRLEKENVRLEDQLGVLKGKIQELEVSQRKIDIANTFGSAGPLMDEARNIDSQLKVNWQALELLCENNEKFQQEINKTSKALKERMSTMIELLRGCEQELGTSGDVEVDLYLDIAALTIQEAIRDHRATESLRERNDKMKQLIDQGMVYAKQEHEGKIRHAALSISNNKYLCIHHLNEDPVAPNSVILQYEEAMRLVNPVSRLSFIELKSTTDDKVLGKLMIRLTHDTKRAKNFQLLCTGQEGPSYADTNIFTIMYKGTGEEYVWMGDYELGTGYGGKSLVPGAASEDGDVLNRSWKAGVVRSAFSDKESTISQFQIYTQDKPEKLAYYSFGYVEKGLQILIDAMDSYQEIREVKISECGMVLRTL